MVDTDVDGNIDVKASTYKKLGAFMAHLEELGWLDLSEQRVLCQCDLPRDVERLGIGIETDHLRPGLGLLEHQREAAGATADVVVVVVLVVATVATVEVVVHAVVAVVVAVAALALSSWYRAPVR